MDHKDVEAQAWQSYRDHLGKVLEVTEIDGWRQLHGLTVVPERPLLVKVEPTTGDDIIRWHDEWLDPIWNVKPIEDYPELYGMDGFWIFGVSFSLSGEKGEPRWSIAEKPTLTRTDIESQSDQAWGGIHGLRSAFSRAAAALGLRALSSRIGSRRKKPSVT